jgi:16S rRNA (uracil1498-N3)-methyltransferase
MKHSLRTSHGAPMFFAPELAPPGAVVTLDPDETRHAVGARRLKEGDALTLFDGKGTTADGVVVHLDRRRSQLQARIEARLETPAPIPRVLASAVPKGDRLSVMLDMATQLGMTRFVPLACERSVVKASAKATTRWQRICLEACKQSRRPWLPTIDAVAIPAEAVAREAAAGAVWLAQPDGRSVRHAGGDGSLCVVIGPEGGFTSTEVERMVAAGAQCVSLGTGILRVETAAVAALALAGV